MVTLGSSCLWLKNIHMAQAISKSCSPPLHSARSTNTSWQIVDRQICSDIVFCSVTPCISVDMFRHLKETCCHHHQLQCQQIPMKRWKISTRHTASHLRWWKYLLLILFKSLYSVKRKTNEVTAIGADTAYRHLNALFQHPSGSSEEHHDKMLDFANTNTGPRFQASATM